MKVVEYIDHAGKSPFATWFKKLDNKTKARVSARVSRFKNGNLGDVKIVGDGVFEARMFFGPGYRLYFGIDKGKLIVLLGGGDKSKQSKDIRIAIMNWKEYGQEN